MKKSWMTGRRRRFVCTPPDELQKELPTTMTTLLLLARDARGTEGR